MSRIDANPGTVVADVAPVAVATNGEVPKRRGRMAGTKVAYHGLADGKKLTAWPSDLGPNDIALSESDFEEGHLDAFYDQKAAEMKAKADVWSEKARTFRMYGALVDRKALDKAIEAQATMKKSIETLVAQNPTMDLAKLTEIFGTEILARLGMVPATV